MREKQRDQERLREQFMKDPERERDQQRSTEILKDIKGFVDICGDVGGFGGMFGNLEIERRFA